MFFITADVTHDIVTAVPSNAAPVEAATDIQKALAYEHTVQTEFAKAAA